ncbi:MAG: DUF2934 domain-containing protein [Betaproteobacteria bacterium]|nr:DUF2934 domain-containing protein [Betaproteobacteria bacterium]
MATDKERRAAPRKPASKAESALRKRAAPKAKPLSDEELYRLIAETAYYKAKARGFAPGGEVQDWIEAEREVRERLHRPGAGAP